jgi:predicted naringenin-chalcone synthase
MRDVPSAWILGIGTALPEHRLDQEDAARRLADALRDNPAAARWARRIFRQCGVDTRYTCEPNLLAPPDRCRYWPGGTGTGAPTTAERMAVYRRKAVPLAREAASSALADASTDASAVTHLITVSCTGQFLPGIDAALVGELGLSPRVQRIPLTFLGCAAGLRAIGLAEQLLAGNPAACVLVVCVELCTLHLQPSDRREDLFAASFFGDGASACVIGAAGGPRAGGFQLGRHQSVLLAGTAEEMVWTVGDHGFELVLSPDIPRLIGDAVVAATERMTAGTAPPELWAIHPGGRGIVDAVQAAFGLTDAQTRCSRNVLRQFGNLSSATLLFVLDALRRERGAEGRSAAGLALAFGPGLTIELQPFVHYPAAGEPAPEGDGRENDDVTRKIGASYAED